MVRRTTRHDKPDPQSKKNLRTHHRRAAQSRSRRDKAATSAGTGACSGPSPDQLLNEAIGGNEAAFDQLSLHHSPRLSRLARRILKDKGVCRTEHTEHVVNATLDLAKAIFPWRYQHESATGFRRWLNRLLSNQIRDRIKYVFARCRDERRERSTGGIDQDGNPSPLTQLLVSRIDAPDTIALQAEMRDAMHQRLLRVFHALRPDEQLLFALFYFVGFSWAEIAELLHLPSPEAARMAKSRALDRLKRNLR